MSLLTPFRPFVRADTYRSLVFLATAVPIGATALGLLIAGWTGLRSRSILEFRSAEILWGIAFLMHGLLFAALLLPARSLEGAGWSKSLGEMVRLRRFWILVLVSISINVCWHFLVNWLPSYLKEDRDLTGLVDLLRRVARAVSFRGDPKYLASGLPANQVQVLARLVDEVHDVPSIEVHMIGGRAQEHVGKRG